MVVWRDVSEKQNQSVHFILPLSSSIAGVSYKNYRNSTWLSNMKLQTAILFQDEITYSTCSDCWTAMFNIPIKWIKVPLFAWSETLINTFIKLVYIQWARSSSFTCNNMFKWIKCPYGTTSVQHSKQGTVPNIKQLLHCIPTKVPVLKVLLYRYAAFRHILLLGACTVKTLWHISDYMWSMSTDADSNQARWMVSLARELKSIWIFISLHAGSLLMIIDF